MDDRSLRWWQRGLGWGCLVSLVMAVWFTFDGPAVTFENLGPMSDDKATVSCQRWGNSALAGERPVFRFEATEGEKFLTAKSGGYPFGEMRTINEACGRAIGDRLHLSVWFLAGSITSGLAAAIVGVHRRIADLSAAKPDQMDRVRALLSGVRPSADRASGGA